MKLPHQGFLRQQAPGGALLLRADYTYDVWGRRIEKTVDPDGAGPQPAQVTRFAYDGANVWADLDGNSSLTTRRLYLDAVDAVFARIDASGEAAWYLPDRLGSVRDIVTTSGGQNHPGLFPPFRLRHLLSLHHPSHWLSLHQPNLPDCFLLQ